MTPWARQRRRALAGLSGLAWCGLAPVGALAAAPGAQRRPWPAKLATPALELPGHEGPAWSLRAARGRPVLLNFWAGWCEPCRSEMPSLELLAQRHQADGLLVMAVNFRETDAAIRRFIDSSALSLPVLRDSDGAAAKAFGVRIFPTTVAIGRQGQALFSVVGEADWTGSPAREWVAALVL